MAFNVKSGIILFVCTRGLADEVLSEGEVILLKDGVERQFFYLAL